MRLKKQGLWNGKQKEGKVTVTSYLLLNTHYLILITCACVRACVSEREGGRGRGREGGGGRVREIELSARVKECSSKRRRTAI